MCGFFKYMWCFKRSFHPEIPKYLANSFIVFGTDVNERRSTARLALEMEE